jgi:hypothetical protein
MEQAAWWEVTDERHHELDSFWAKRDMLQMRNTPMLLVGTVLLSQAS